MNRFLDLFPFPRGFTMSVLGVHGAWSFLFLGVFLGYEL